MTALTALSAVKSRRVGGSCFVVRARYHVQAALAIFSRYKWSDVHLEMRTRLECVEVLQTRGKSKNQIDEDCGRFIVWLHWNQG